MPMMVVIQSIVPIRISVKQNRTAFLTMFRSFFPFADSYQLIVKEPVMYSEC
jgi:hypothetical protein